MVELRIPLHFKVNRGLPGDKTKDRLEVGARPAYCLTGDAAGEGGERAGEATIWSMFFKFANSSATAKVIRDTC